jgi:hypothetical protein
MRVAPIAHQLIVTHQNEGPKSWERSHHEWESGNSRFNGQKRKQNHAIATGPSWRDMARSKRCQRREPVKDFIILTGFSRCQGGMIGRVSRRQNSPRQAFEDLGFEDKDFP